MERGRRSRRVSPIGALLAGALALAPGFGASSARAESGEAPKAEAGIQWASSFVTAMEEARAENRVVMVDFYTHWCGWCKVLDRKTYVDPKVVERASRLVNVKINAEADVATASKYEVQAYPTILFLNPDGSVRQALQGFRPPEQFVGILDQVTNVEGEMQSLAYRVLNEPRDPALRRSFADVLAVGGRWTEAVAQLDTLLMIESGGIAAEAALDRAVLLGRAGQTELARTALRDWIKKQERHSRVPEAQFQLARIEEAGGKAKDAKKLYERVSKVAPGSWFAEEARARLKVLSS